MPSHPTGNVAQEVLELSRLVKGAVETAELFGEEDFALPKAEARAKPAATAKVSVASGSGNKEERLRALYQKYAGCQNCRLGATRKKFVFGVGVPEPKALFVGEGPGYEEDRQGFPFVGKAGQLLDKILASVGLDRKNNAYIANIVKCHPMRDPEHPETRGNDRPPEPDEMAACREILEQQIEILDPPVIVALGSVAAKALIGTETGITRLRGKIFQFEIPRGGGRTVPLIPTYHPAALLRNELLKKDVWQDMKSLKSLMEAK